MHRRTFIKQLFCLPLLVLGPGARECAQDIPQFDTRRIPLLDTHVAGFRYYEGERIWDYLDTGDPLELRREPSNPHDARATALYWREHKIGYIPRTDNAAVAGFLDQGAPLKASIKQKNTGAGPWECLQVEVVLEV